MAEAEHPGRTAPGHQVTVEDVRRLMGASTPHFALQLRNRIRKLIRGLAPDDPARLEGEREIARLDRLGFTGEIRGDQGPPDQPPMPSLGEGEPSRYVEGATHG